jgi:starch synthase
MSDPLRILYVAAEVAPFVKVGGLADVAGALPKALRELSHDVRVIMPHYRQIDDARYGLRPALDGKTFAVPGSAELAGLDEAESGGVPVYFVSNERYFGRERVYGEPDDVDRFLFFCRAALEALQRLDWQPDVVNCNDWHTAAIPLWMRTRGLGGSAAAVITIHNLAYQGGFDPAAYREWFEESALYRRPDGGMNLLAQAIRDADIVTTVSERYAH